MALAQRLAGQVGTDRGTFGTVMEIPTGPGVHFLDLTDSVARFVWQSRLEHGLVNIQSLHTTAGVVINENERLLHADLKRMLEAVAPSGQRYEHDDFPRRLGPLEPDEPENGHAHCKALLLPTSLAVNVVDGRVMLGRWQRIFLVELDGPRSRSISVVTVGSRR